MTRFVKIETAEGQDQLVNPDLVSRITRSVGSHTMIIFGGFAGGLDYVSATGTVDEVAAILTAAPKPPPARTETAPTVAKAAPRAPRKPKPPRVVL